LSRKLYHCCSGDETKRTNAILLITSFLVITLDKSPEDAYAPFAQIRHSLAKYNDVWRTPNVPGVTILDCLRGLHKAIAHNFFDFRAFDAENYDYMQEVLNGDMNWIIPEKILAFKGPRATPKNQPSFTPEYYIPRLSRLGVKTVVRLNKQHYDKAKFMQHGISHYDMYFGDGTTPSNQIVQDFLNLFESEQGAIAVHCKGGIGRTGTLIAICLMRHYNFTSEEAIAWARICRPGSVMGAQQLFLMQYDKSRHENNSEQGRAS